VRQHHRRNKVTDNGKADRRNHRRT
jgi:hypothetical protein